MRTVESIQNRLERWRIEISNPWVELDPVAGRHIVRKRVPQGGRQLVVRLERGKIVIDDQSSRNQTVMYISETCWHCNAPY